MLESNGERYLPYIDPSISGAEIHYEHLHRYAFASQYVKGKKVLDLASGEGYGTFILSKNADYVIGVEIDGSAVTHAIKTYKKENIEFREGSILKIPIEGEKKFDVIVCFEALEHVKEHDTLFIEIIRLLKDDGILIISTPNKQIYTDDTGYQNPFHQKELYYSEFSDFLKKYFLYSYLFGQRVFSGSSISPTTVNAPNSWSEFFIEQDKNHFTFTRDDEKISKYFIAIASNGVLNKKKIQKSYLIDKSNAEIALLHTRVSQYNILTQSLELALAAKDRQILDVTASVHSLEQTVATKDQQIIDLSATVHSLEQTVATRDQQIIDLSATVHSLEQTVATRDQQIIDLSATVHSLEQTVATRDQQIIDLSATVHSLERTVATRDQQIIDLSATVHSLEQTVETRNQQIIDLSATVHSLEQTVADMDQKIEKIDSQFQLLRDENDSIKKSISYKLVTKFHRCIVERLLPLNTRRRNNYELALKGGRILVNEGWNSFWGHYQERERRRSQINDMRISPSSTNIVVSSASPALSVINKTISIIIPTKNAGIDFQYTLQKIQNQVGIQNIELIIVDSGSNDDTIDIARRYGSKIFSIKPENFNHGETRNYAAQKASGDYLLFLVQDAIPIGHYWLYKIINVLESDSQIAAVSCRQVPRSDADLFACFIMWSHYDTFDMNRDRITKLDRVHSEKIPFNEKRSLGGLDNVCCCIRKEVFEKFKFKQIIFAEDLELGIRLIEHGYKLGFLNSVGVVHSHNRPQEYYIRRSYVDGKLLAEIFNQGKPFENNCHSQVLTSLFSIYDSLNAAIIEIMSESEELININVFFMILKKLVLDKKVTSSHIIFDQNFDTLIMQIKQICEVKGDYDNYLYAEFIYYLQRFENYLKNVGDVYEKREIIEAILKLYCSFCGIYLAYLYFSQYNREKFTEVDKLLSKGV